MMFLRGWGFFVFKTLATRTGYGLETAWQICVLLYKLWPDSLTALIACVVGSVKEKRKFRPYNNISE